ncbi:UNVERIFIED_CONTAM: hypothetical protein FKN15_076904, partial [Acipenser sinensis]
AVLSVFQWAVFWPQQVPYEALGLVGAFSKHMVEHHYPLLYYGSVRATLCCLFKHLQSERLVSQTPISTDLGLHYLR